VALTLDDIRARLAEYDPYAPRCPGAVVRKLDLTPACLDRGDPDYASCVAEYRTPCALAAGHAGDCRSDRPVLGWPGYAVLSDLVDEVERLRRQVAALVETGVSIHRHVATERAAVVTYLVGCGLDTAAADVRDGVHIGGRTDG